MAALILGVIFLGAMTCLWWDRKIAKAKDHPINRIARGQRK